MHGSIYSLAITYLVCSVYVWIIIVIYCKKMLVLMKKQKDTIQVNG